MDDCWSFAADRFQKGEEMKIRHPLFVGLLAAFAVSLALASASAVAARLHSREPWTRLKRGR